MGFSENHQTESSCSTDALDFIDLREFHDKCIALKKEIKKTSESTLPLEKDLDEVEAFPAVNPSYVQKWQVFLESHPNVEEKDLYQMILSDDAGLSSDAARKEAALAMRIARSKLAAVEAYKEEAVSSTGPKPSRSIPITSIANSNDSGSNDAALEDDDDVILTITVNNGTKPHQIQSSHRQELEVKASQSLLSFTEQIYCLSKRVACEISDKKEKEVIESSSFLFIENVFYDDELDASGPVRPSDIYFNAMKEAGEFSPIAHLLVSDPSSVQRKSLKSTTWIDLKIRLNTPYLFAHLGGCEHTIVITQVRASNPNEDQPPFDSTRVTQALRVRRRKCRICEVYAGTKMLINDKLMPENPCIICDKCFEGFHGTKKPWYTDFEVVPYYHES